MDDIERAIRAKREQDNQKKEQQANLIAAKNERAIEKIRSFAPRIKRLIDVATMMIDNNYPLGRKLTSPIYHDEFVTEIIHHKVGFYKNGSDNYNQLYVGIKAGGWDGAVDLVVDGNGEIIRFGKRLANGELYHVQHFAKEFEDFEKSFMEYVSKEFGVAWKLEPERPIKSINLPDGKSVKKGRGI